MPNEAHIASKVTRNVVCEATPTVDLLKPGCKSFNAARSSESADKSTIDVGTDLVPC